MAYEVRKLSVLVVPGGEPIHSEMATTVTIVDDGGGQFVEVEQDRGMELGKIAINPEEWPALRSAVDEMIGLCV